VPKHVAVDVCRKWRLTECIYWMIYIDYELDGQGIESWWGVRFSAPVQTGPETHPASCIMGKVRPGRDADPSPPSSAEVKNRVVL
jgi:hypothetical protein